MTLRRVRQVQIAAILVALFGDAYLAFGGVQSGAGAPLVLLIVILVVIPGILVLRRPGGLAALVLTITSGLWGLFAFGLYADGVNLALLIGVPNLLVSITTIVWWIRSAPNEIAEEAQPGGTPR